MAKGPQRRRSRGLMQTLRSPSARPRKKKRPLWKRVLGFVIGGLAIALLALMLGSQVVSLLAPHLLTRPTVHNVEVLAVEGNGVRVELFEQETLLPTLPDQAVEVGDPVTVEFRYRGKKGDRQFTIDAWYRTKETADN